MLREGRQQIVKKFMEQVLRIALVGKLKPAIGFGGKLILL